MRGATCKADTLHKYLNISIRAPHAGSDGMVEPLKQIMRIISIRAPHAGSDSNELKSKHGPKAFQSALPMRGAT